MSDLILVQENSTPETVELVSAGPQGPSGTFTIGTITTGLAGSSANVTNTGTPSQAVLNFTIPRGDVGDVTPEATAAKNAAQSASSAAATSQVVASNAATSATASASSAQQSATAAASSSSTATSKAAEASTSAASAESSEIVALGASSTATLKASEAGSFATAASTSAASSETSANASASYAAAASGSANASATSAGNASGSASLAQEWATKTISEVALGQGYGAKKYALDAASMAAAAEIAAAGSLVHSQTAAGHSQSASTSADNANTSASVSSDASVLATLRAGQAAESASTSSSQAANASASAATATSQASSATASASTASTQAGIATTKASEASTSASAASVSAVAALASQTASAGSAAAANTSAGSAAGSASSALAIYGTTNAQQAALVAAQSAASLAQGFALSASSAIQQDLSGVTAQALHRSPNAVTAMFVYDTSKDSDGGAWTEKCQHTSWYNEALNGKWLGAWDNEFQARHAGATASSTEVLTNGAFDSNITGWTAGAGSAAWAAGTAQITGSSGVIARLFQAMTLTAGKTYRLTATCVSTTDTSTTLEFLGGSVSTTFNAGQTKSLYFSPGSTGTFYAQVRNTNAGAVVSAFDNISVREVTALTTASGDYYQSTVDGKFYRLWKNLLQQTNNVSNSFWTKNSVTVDDLNSISVDAVVLQKVSVSTTLGSLARGIYRQFTGFAGAKSVSFHAKADGLRYATLAMAGALANPAPVFDLQNGVVTNTPYGTAWMEPKGNGVYRCYWTLNATTDMSFAVYLSDVSSANTTSVNDGVSGAYIGGLQLEYGSTATAYEAKTVGGSVTETFRGNKADFPRLAGIVAEAASVTIYDLTEAGRPMWMRFVCSSTSNWWSGSNGPTSIAMTNAVMFVGSSGAGSRLVNFAKEGFDIAFAYSTNRPAGGIATRNGALTVSGLNSYVVVNNNTHNAVAMTVLPDAPVDAVTGLQVPTIAVATAGGLSFIKHNGTVVNITNTFYVSFAEVAFEKNGSILARQFSGSPFFPIIIRYFKVPEASYSVTATSIGVNGYVVAAASALPMRLASSGGNYRVTPNTVSYNDTVYRYKGNISEGGKSALVTITNTFNTGHLIGDIRRAYLADVGVGSVSGTELVTNGTFDTDVSGWTAQVSTVDRWSVVNGKLTLNASGDAAIWQGVPTVVGKTYQARVTSAGVADAQIRFINSNNINGAILGTVVVPNTGSLVYNFTATTTFAVFQLRANTAGATYDDVSLKEVVADRSYKASGAPITGTLTKTQVAGAASQLVAYSGFSAANYLREPYSADLDFGTGEWSASAWVNVPVNPQFYQNLCINSNTFSSGWAQDGLIVTPSYETVGGLVYTRLQQPATSTSGNRIWIASPTTILNVSTNTSIYVRRIAGSSDKLRLSFIGAWNPIFNTTTYDPVTQTVSGPNAAAFSITVIDADTARVSVVAIKGANSTSAYWNIDVVNTAGTNFGGGTGGLAVAGFQMTVGAALVPYEATGATVVPRLHPIADRAHSSGARIAVGFDGTGYIAATAFDGTNPARTVTTTAAYNTATWIKPEAVYTTDGTLAIRVNGVEVAATRGTPLLSLNSQYNLVLGSEDFGVTPMWTAFPAVSVTKNAITVGAIGLSLVIPSTANSAKQSATGFALAGGPLTVSLHCKAAGYRYLQVIDGGNGAFGVAVFDAVAGAFVQNTYALATSVVDVGNSVYKITITSLNPASQGLQIAIVNSPTGNTNYNSVAFAGDGTSGMYIGGIQRVSGTVERPYQKIGLAGDVAFGAPLTIGNSYATDAPFPGSISLLKLSATVPTAEQSQWMYEQEKQMFRDGAQVCLPDSGSIVDLTYDDATDKWIAVSATNESEWSGLVRTSVTPSPAGSYTKVFAASGVQLQARSTTNPGVDITIPSYGLREELVNRSQAAARLARNMVAFDYVGGFTANTTTGATSITSVASLTYPVSYVGARISGAGIPANTTVVAVSGTTIYMSAAATATASAVQISFVDFTLPVGYEAKNVLSAGATKVEGATKDFTRLFDGFKETIRFGTAPGFNVPVQIQATRSVQ